jgi:para-nitrobenzyl esterase
MKKSLLLVAFGCFLTTSAFSQSTECDGTRYFTDLFPQIKKTTVVYGSNANVIGITENLAMDIYEPVGDVLAKRPLIVCAHGGSFISGARGDMAGFCSFFAKKGFVVATIDYRLYPFLVQGFPDSLDIMDDVVKAVGDMRCAVRYFRQDAANANVYKIDPNRILVGGYSAGAVAAMHLAQMSQTDNLPTFVQNAITANGGWEGSTGSAANLQQSSDVRAVISLSGGLYKKAWIDATNDKPFISYHGVIDNVVYYNFGIAAGIMSLNGSGNLHPVADAVGLKNYIHSVPTGDHSNIHFDATFQADRDIFYSKGMQFLFDNVLCSPTATDDFSEKKALEIAPNPTSDFVKITLPESTENWSVEVTDLVGRRVFFKKNVANSLEINKLQVGGSVGMFVISATNVRGERLISKVIFE